MSHETGDPVDKPPEERKLPGDASSRSPEDFFSVVESGERPESVQPSGLEGCVVAVGKAIFIIAIGVFVIGGLVFATCFLAVRR